MKIFLGSDHAGFELKNKLVDFLKKEKHDVVDFGAQKFDKEDDYPDFIIPVAQHVAKHANSRGIVLGGSGQGEAIAANKVKGVRAALYYGGAKDIVVLSRTHNDANVLSLGARFVSEKEAKEAVKTWLETNFSGDERHVRRIEKISDFEEQREKLKNNFSLVQKRSTL